MSPANSPSLQEYTDGIAKKRRDPDAREKTLRFVFLVVLVIVLSLLFMLFLNTSLGGRLTGKGTLIGRVIDSQGQPLVAQVFVLGAARPVISAADGSFTFKNAPAGNHFLTIAFDGRVVEYQVQVQAGEIEDLGDLTFTVTSLPAQP
jgi:Carboxypeptidase regulatory-like domain